MRDARLFLLVGWFLVFAGVLPAADQVVPRGNQAARPKAAALLPAPVPDVFLKNDFIELGMHSLGSFGAASGDHPNGLGFRVDLDGWAGPNAPTTGDFFYPGAVEEAWGVSWTVPDVEIGTRRIVKMNAGMSIDALRTDIAVETGYPIGSSPTTFPQRSLWQGVTSGGQALRVTQTVSFGRTDRFFVVSVTLKNESRTTLTDLIYLRTVDPDQDYELHDQFETENYVVYQNQGATDAFPSTNADKALVVGRGPTSGVTVGLGSIDKRARVAYATTGTNPIALRDPLKVLTLGTGTDNNTLADSARKPAQLGSGVAIDTAIALAFDLGDLPAGQSTVLDFAYILDEADLEVALGSLADVSILQPSGTVSGASALFQVTTRDPSNTSLVEFFVAGVKVDSDSEPSGGIFETTFDTRGLSDGVVSIEAVATFGTGPNATTSRRSRDITIDNAGPPIAFAGATPAHGASVSGSTLEIVIGGGDPQDLPFQVTIQREAIGFDPLLLTPAFTALPYTATCPLDDLPDGTVFSITAVATSEVGRATRTIQRSFVRVVGSGGGDPEDVTLVAPALPLSRGEETIYTAVCPSTPQGRSSLVAALTGSDPTITRAYRWDAAGAAYQELSSAGALAEVGITTGIFIATRVELSYALTGTPSESLALEIARDGWTFAGIPPLPDGNGGYVTTIAWIGNDAGLEVAVVDPDVGILADVMGTIGSADDSTARPWHWNGRSYIQVDRLEAGKGYWFKNNLTEQDIILEVEGTAVRSARVLAKAKAARTAAPRPMRDQGAPPPPPSASAQSSSSSGCGVGSGLASLALVLLAFSLRFLVARR